MNVYAAVDSGGSKTRVVAVTENGEIRADFRTGSADVTSMPVERLGAVLKEISEKLETSVVMGDAKARLVVGLPGFGEVQRWDDALLNLCARTFFTWPWTVQNDVRLALAGALAGAPGAMVLSGTGSMAWALAPDGREARVGGWGPPFGDEGSSYRIGIDGLRAASHAVDGRGPQTGLLAAFLRAHSKETLWGVVGDLLEDPGSSRSRIAALSSIVDIQAQAGDAIARSILHRAAEDLAAHLDAVFDKLELPTTAAISFAGGSFRSTELRLAFSAYVREIGLSEPALPRFGPVQGGLLMGGCPESALLRVPPN